MKMITHRLGFLIVISLFLVPNFSAAVTVEKVVAIVNGTPITMYDLDEAVKAIGPEISKKNQVSGKTLRAKVLDQLINDKILEQALDKSELVVEQHEIDTYIDRILRSSRISITELEQQLLTKGTSLAEYRQHLSQQILRNKFVDRQVGRKISISERELKEYFGNHLDEFKSTTAARLAQITIPFTATTRPEDLKKLEKTAVIIAKEAQSTSDFESLAKKYNGKPHIVQGGDVGVVQIKDLNPQIGNIAKQLDIGQSSGPVVTNSGIQIIKILDKAKISAKDFNSVRDQVYNKIFDIKIDEALKGYINQLKKTTQIEIKSL